FLAVDAVKGSRRIALAFGLAALGAIFGGWILWHARRLPVTEARNFLNAPIEVGEEPPPAAMTPEPPGTVPERFATGRSAFTEGRYADAAGDFAWVVAHDPSGPTAGPAQWNLVRSRLRSGDANGALSALHDLLAQHAGWLGEQSPHLREGAEC